MGNHCEAADSAQACQEQCQKEEHCQEFTFITNANEKDQNCCHIESRTEGNEQTVTGFVSGPKFCGNNEESPVGNEHDHEHEHDNSPVAPEVNAEEPESPEAAPEEPVPEEPAPEETAPEGPAA